MNPKERFESAINNEKPDRMPLGYHFFGAGNSVLRALGLSFKDAYYSSKCIAKAQLKALEMFGHDNVNAPWGCLNVESEAFGCELAIKKDDYPVTKGPIINHYEDLETMKIPEPTRSGRMPLVLESIKLLDEKIGKSNPVIGFMCSPAIVAAEIRGFENFLMDSIRDPKFIRQILKTTTKACEEYLEAMVNQGAFAVMIENSCSGRDILDPNSCDELVVRFNREVINRAKKLNVYSIIYNSSTAPYIDKDLSLKPDVLSFHMGDKKSIMEEYGWDCDKFHNKIGACTKRSCIPMINDVCLMGNVNHANTMLNGTYDDVYKEAMNCLESSKNREGGFILSTGCEVPFDAPIENMIALRDAVEAYSI